MKIDFVKYQGAGNDFIIIDDYESDKDSSVLTVDNINRLCDRRFGIGADGLMILKNHADYDFEMVYYNSDGRVSSMCGNGGRCIVDMAYRKGIIDGSSCSFLAVDGPHKAKVNKDVIELEMTDVSHIECKKTNEFFLDTGSPHYVVVVSDLKMDLVTEAHKIRYNPTYREEGTNVNFIKPITGGIEIRTYERGVEAETLACGTGVTAAALAYTREFEPEATRLEVIAQGGNLSVRFDKKGDGWTNIWLIGPAQRVFEGSIDLNLIT